MEGVAFRDENQTISLFDHQLIICKSINYGSSALNRGKRLKEIKEKIRVSCVFRGLFYWPNFILAMSRLSVALP